MQFANVHNGMEVKNNVQREGGTCRFANIPFPQDQHLWKKQLDPPYSLLLNSGTKCEILFSLLK